MDTEGKGSGFKGLALRSRPVPVLSGDRVKFREHLKVQEMSRTEETWRTPGVRTVRSKRSSSKPTHPLFGLVALGLAAYGVFQFFLARYRRMVIG